MLLLRSQFPSYPPASESSERGDSISLTKIGGKHH